LTFHYNHKNALSHKINTLHRTKSDYHLGIPKNILGEHLTVPPWESLFTQLDMLTHAITTE